MPTIDKQILKTLRIEINTALEDVAKKHNVSLKAASASYSPTDGTATFKLEVLALGDGGATRDIPAELFIKNAAFLGLDPSDLHKEIKLQDRRFKVTGYKPKARKNCITIQDSSGKTFVTDVATIKRHLHKK